MAAKSFTRDEVLEQILREENEFDVQEEEKVSEIDDVDRQEEMLEEMLSTFDGGEGFDFQFFRENAKVALLPILRHSFPIENTLGKEQKLKAALRLSTSQLSVGSVLDEESRSWLKAIHRRLCGKVHSRNPYRGEICRSIPYGIFSTARQVLRDFGIQEPDCYIASNRKGEVIAFTSLKLVADYFSCLSGLSVKEVKPFFTRTLATGSRYQHKVKLVISKEIKTLHWFTRKEVDNRPNRLLRNVVPLQTTCHSLEY